MDLTTEFPSSPRTLLFGVAGLQRAIDKGIAKGEGKIGEYHYNCPLDAMVFEFLGINHEELYKVITTGSKEDIHAFVKPYIDKKNPAEIEAFNTKFFNHASLPGSEGYQYFLEMRSKIAPERTDVTTWVDLLDLEEKRNVPQRVAA